MTSEDVFMNTLGKKFDEWRHNPLGGSHRAPGGNCMDAVRKLGAGVSWTQSGGLDFKGNGSAMRSGIVGAYYWKNPQYAFSIGGLTSVCTHNNLEAILGSAVVSYLVAASISGQSFARSIGEVLGLCSNFSKTLPFYPKQVKFGGEFSDQNPWYAIARFGTAYALATDILPTSEVIVRLMDHECIVTDGAVVPAVAEAIFFTSRFNSFSESVLWAVNNSDDTDTVGAITGTIVGAYRGVNDIPLEWVEGIELQDYFFDLSDRIWGASEAVEAKEENNHSTIEAIRCVSDNEIDIFEDGEPDSTDSGDSSGDEGDFEIEW